MDSTHDPVREYTASCREHIEKYGQCHLQIETDLRVPFTFTEALLAATGVVMETISAFQLHRVFQPSSPEAPWLLISIVCIAGSGAVSVAKLFPPADGGSCATRPCRRLVHCASLTLAAVPLDLVVIGALYVVKRHAPAARRLRLLRRNASEEDPASAPEAAAAVAARPPRARGVCGAVAGPEAAWALLELSKAGGLAASASWVLADVAEALATLPADRPGALALGAGAAAASGLLLLLEMGMWLALLPKKAAAAAPASRGWEARGAGDDSDAGVAALIPV